MLDFAAAARLPFEASPAWAVELFRSCVNDPDKTAIVTDGGVLLAAVGPSLMGPFRASQELAWWIEPARRGGGEIMIEEYERWAIGMGAKLIGGVSMAAFPWVETIYQRRGYARLETHWVRRAD